MAVPWFRMYASARHDPKLQLLSPGLFKHWFNLICVASDQEDRGSLPDFGAIAYELHVNQALARKIVEQLWRAELLDEDSGHYRIHGWETRQFTSDGDNTRAQRYRSRLRELGESPEDYRKLRPQVFERDGAACVYCGATENLVIDHLVPVLRGGDSQLDNLVTACKACNAGKAGRLLEETLYRLRHRADQERYNTVLQRLQHRVVSRSQHALRDQITDTEAEDRNDGSSSSRR